MATLLLARGFDRPEEPVKCLYIEPPLENIRGTVRAVLSPDRDRDVLVASGFPVTVPVELYTAAVERAGFPTDFVAEDLPWTVPDRELTYVCIAITSINGKKVCALLRLHPVPDNAAWFGSIDFGAGP